MTDYNTAENVGTVGTTHGTVSTPGKAPGASSDQFVTPAGMATTPSSDHVISIPAKSKPAPTPLTPGV